MFVYEIDVGELITRAARVQILDVYILGDKAAMGWGGGGGSAPFCFLMKPKKKGAPNPISIIIIAE